MEEGLCPDVLGLCPDVPVHCPNVPVHCITVLRLLLRDPAALQNVELLWQIVAGVCSMMWTLNHLRNSCANCSGCLQTGNRLL